MVEDQLLIRCNFCGRRQDETERLLVSEEENIFICEECVNQFYDMLDSQKARRGLKELAIVNLRKPAQIKEELDKYVIGQDRAKKALSVAVYNHYQRILALDENDEVELAKSNILLIGPTGSGKTLLAETLARLLNVPFTVADATSLTEAGYVGDDVETMLQTLLHKCDYDVQKAEGGIIYLDEIDKIARKSENTSITRDVSGEGVQQGLLKIIEGTVARVPKQGNRKHSQQECIEINTRNILFICGGAFDGLEKIVQRRTEQYGIGFTATTLRDLDKRTNSLLLSKTEPEDLVKFGLIPELVGRLPLVTVLDELAIEDLVTILTQPKNALIKQYSKLFALDKITLRFEEIALEEIAKQALRRGTGARGLRSILEQLLLDIRFQAPSLTGLKEILITEAVVKGEIDPILIKE